MKRLRSSGTVAGIDPSGSVDVLQQITDMLRGIQADVSQIIVDYNKELFTTIGTLPQGKAETRWRLSNDNINPRLNNLDGANVFVDTDASATANGGRFWLSNATTNRPKTIKESLLDLYTSLSSSIDQLRTEIVAIGQGNPVAIYNTSLATANLVESDLRSIVFDGSSVTASSAGVGAVSVTSSGGGGGGGSGVRGPRVVVGNSNSGDTTTTCDYLDVGNGANLEAAITAAGLLSPVGDVWVRPGLYDFSVTGGPSAGIVLPTGVKVRGASRDSVTVRGNSSGDMNIFYLAEAAELEDILVEVPLPTAAGSGSGAVELQGDRSECRRVVVDYLSPSSYTVTEADDLGVTNGFYVGSGDTRIKLTDCGVGLGGPGSEAPALGPINGGTLRGFYIDQPAGSVAADVTRCRVVGSDIAFYAARTTRFNNCEVEDAYSKGFYINSSQASNSQITNAWIEMVGDQGTEIGIHLRQCYRVDVSNNFLKATSPTVGVVGIYIQSYDDNVISGNRGSGWNIPVELGASSGNNTVLGNRLGAVTDNGDSNDVAHNG